jgi:uncharacterized membrane protein YfcA
VTGVLSPADVLLLVAAGLAAGVVNAGVGSGSLITFPTLLALGYPPVLANVTNCVGMVPGSVGGAWSYRRELADQRQRVVRLGSAAALGGVLGAGLLLVLPSSVFDAVVPVLVALAVVLVAVQPWLSRRLADVAQRAHPAGGRGVTAAVALTGLYGGYFGAAQGVLLLAVLTIGLAEGVQRANALKNVLAGSANLAGALVFALASEVDWLAAAAIAVGAGVGGVVGGGLARRLPPIVLRGLVVVVGGIALVQLLT